MVECAALNRFLSELTRWALDRSIKPRRQPTNAVGPGQKISLNADAASQQQGEGIQVVDAAYLPSQPVAPKRLLLFVLGLGLGLGFGLILASAFELPKLRTIQTREDAAHYTGLPVLASVPELLTAQEARAIPRRRRLLLAAGIAATIVSIPVLAFLLRATHVFEMLTSGRT